MKLGEVRDVERMSSMMERNVEFLWGRSGQLGYEYLHRNTVANDANKGTLRELYGVSPNIM
jgi:hypothetical protein